MHVKDKEREREREEWNQQFLKSGFRSTSGTGGFEQSNERVSDDEIEEAYLQKGPSTLAALRQSTTPISGLDFICSNSASVHPGNLTEPE